MPTVVRLPVDRLLAPETVDEALATDAVATRVRAKGLGPAPGELVGVRLNLNVLKSTGLAVQTLHRPTNAGGYRRNRGFYNGEACGYAQAVVLRDAYFNVSQPAREAIAEGRHHKFAMASVDGKLVSFVPPEGFEGLEIGFNPKTEHLFVDAEHRAIHSAEEVVVLGHRIYARGRVVYHTPETVPARKGSAPSMTQVGPKPIAASDPDAPAARRSPRP